MFNKGNKTSIYDLQKKYKNLALSQGFNFI